MDQFTDPTVEPPPEALEAFEPDPNDAPVETEEAPPPPILESRVFDMLPAERSRELYRLVVEHSEDLISLHEPSGRILFASPSWEAVTSLSR